MKKRAYEIMIPVYWDQLDIIKWSIPYIKKNLLPKKIILVGPIGMKKNFVLDDNLEYVDGNELIEGMCKESIDAQITKILLENGVNKESNRAGWYFQQFIKMAYALKCSEKNYLVWDADMVPLRPITFFDEDKNVNLFISGGKHHHMVYYNTMSQLLGKEIKPRYENTYVSHYMLIDVEIMCSMLKKIQENNNIRGNIWWEKIMNAIKVQDIQESGFSEFETYGEYVNLYFPDRYELRNYICKITTSRKYLDHNPSCKKLEWASKNYDALGFEKREKVSSFWYLICEKLCLYIEFKTIVNFDSFVQKLSFHHIKNKIVRIIKKYGKA